MPFQQQLPHSVPRLPPIQLPSTPQDNSAQRHPSYPPTQFQHPPYPYPQIPRSFPRSSPPPPSSTFVSSGGAQGCSATFEHPPPIPVAMRHPYPLSTSIRQVPHHAQHTQLQQHIISEPFVPVTPELVNKPPRRRRRPPFSYSSLIAQAILGAPEQKMTLRDIYKWIMEKYPALYKADDTGWQNTIRHNLSLNKCFKKVARTESDSASKGKGGYWTVDPNYMNHFANGAFARGSIIKRKAGETSSAGSSEQSDNEGGGSADVGPSRNQSDAKDPEKRLRHATDDEDDSPGSIEDVDMLDSPGYKRSSVSSSDDIGDYPGYVLQYHQPHSTIVHRSDTGPPVDSVHSRLEHAHIEHSVSRVGVVTLASEIDSSVSLSPLSIPGRLEIDVPTIDVEVELDTPLSSSPVMRIHNILN